MGEGGGKNRYIIIFDYNFYTVFRVRLVNHSNPLILVAAVAPESIPGNPPKRLMRNRSRDSK